jgi:UDP-N-acetylmuramoyl-tripeptide--D-alanyl-D-alanine ligase
VIVDAAWLARSAGGVLAAGDPRAIAPGEICVDTRLLEPGDVFVALPGTRSHGDAHIDEAIRRGAAGVIATAAALRRCSPGLIRIAVTDSRAALRNLARARRREFTGPAIAVTGSIGKTTTVAILEALLAAGRPTHATRGGFNTHLGVAATIAGLPPRARALVVELSMQSAGHIAAKAALMRPTAAVITNIAPVHLETTGSLAQIARNKAELLTALSPGDLCVVPSRAPELEPHLRSDLRVVRHGPGGDVTLRRYAGSIAEIEHAGGCVAVATSLSQAHNLDNLVAAVALLAGLGLPVPREVDARLPPLRWQPARLGELELVLDCFNSSPDALTAALEAFAGEPATRRVAVLGTFAELGPATRGHHRRAGVIAARLGVEIMIAVGEDAGQLLERYSGEGYAVRTPEQARDLLATVGRPGDRILVKGARGAQLERIAA